MKTTLYWFSGTGNSLAVAKLLADQLPDCELISIAKAIHHPPEATERIGIVCPVYAFGPPAIVDRFIQTLKAKSNAYIFAVFTCSQTAGASVHFLTESLRQNGLDLSAAWVVKMPENYPPFGSAPRETVQRKMQSHAMHRVGEIVDQLRQGSPTVKEQGSVFWRTLGAVVYPAFRRYALRRSDRFFRTDNRCNGCELCARICPVGNIRMEDHVPRWLGSCEQCFACFHWCPQRAVQYGKSGRQRRYHHPAVSVRDLIRDSE
ncbi:MAG: 4Fe-4S dicluster domain-containing protein [Kiritimatiellaceae bacterium]|nr:4Fe-4S dicluster domain-containing protein [Kiritimatiellaceae bacterium]